MDTELPLGADPFALCAKWLAQAAESVGRNHNAVSLATCDERGRPDVRVVLLKGISERGLEFFTNRDSDKGRQLRTCPHAAVAAYWAPLGRQLRARGPVNELDRARVAEYFATRSRASQLGAWASEQSRPLSDEAGLCEAVDKYEAQYAAGDVPLPDHWTGYLLAPTAMEFWIEGEARLHRRMRFTREEPGKPWQAQRLFP